MNAQSKRLYHLGAKPVFRSSLARLNEIQPAELYEALFAKLHANCRSFAVGHRFRFKNKLYFLDAAFIDLLLKHFPGRTMPLEIQR